MRDNWGRGRCRRSRRRCGINGTNRIRLAMLSATSHRYRRGRRFPFVLMTSISIKGKILIRCFSDLRLSLCLRKARTGRNDRTCSRRTSHGSGRRRSPFLRWLSSSRDAHLLVRFFDPVFLSGLQEILYEFLVPLQILLGNPIPAYVRKKGIPGGVHAGRGEALLGGVTHMRYVFEVGRTGDEGLVDLAFSLGRFALLRRRGVLFGFR